MNENTSFDRFVADQFAREGDGRRPSDEYVESIVTEASRIRQRPRWLALIKEPPMRLSSRTVIGSPTARLAYVLIVTLVLGLLTLGGIVAGASLLSSPKPMIPPCGDVSCPVGSMAQPRGWHTATLLDDGRVLVVAGDDADNQFDGSLASAEIWDPTTGMFSEAGPLAEGRRAPTATRLADGSVLVIGGVVDGGGMLASAERWDPATGIWSPAGTMAEARAYHTSTLLTDGSVLVTGGGDFADFGDSRSASAELWDPDTGTFSSAGTMAEPRFLHTATLLPDGRVLVVAGNWPPPITLATAEIWDPESKSFSAAGALAEPHGSHSATLLPDGDVLVVGGTGGMDATTDGFLTSAEVWDLSTMSFGPTGWLSEPRTDHAATLLNDGSVLVVGGVDEFEQAMATVERWDPVSGSFGPAGSLTEARGGPALTVLPDGRILLVGGFDAAYQLTVDSAELYDPDAPVGSPSATDAASTS